MARINEAARTVTSARMLVAGLSEDEDFRLCTAMEPAAVLSKGNNKQKRHLLHDPVS